ncbi:methyltransferase domain-containing protein [Idiomarina ramblicola]|nr:methyltransferase domain-containing protein [Idiomarina ramblicola]
MNFQPAVARQFNKAAKHYHQHADIQRLTASKLLSIGPDYASNALDVGCGPASTTADILTRADNYLGVDIAQAMLSKAVEDYPQLTWLNGEWEALPIADNTVDWIFANLSMQWVHDLERAMSEAYRVLKPGGVVTVNTVVEGTFSSFIKSWNAVDDLQHTQAFQTADGVQKEVTALNWQSADFSLDQHTQHFSNVRDLMVSIKGVGANYVRRTEHAGLMTHRRLQQLESAFERYRTMKGLPLEWSILNIKLIK